MSTHISPAAESARENARTVAGKFGPSNTPEPDGVELSTSSPPRPKRTAIGDEVTFQPADGPEVTATIAERAPLGPNSQSMYHAQDDRGRMWEVAKAAGQPARVVADPYALSMRAKAIETIQTGDVRRVTASPTAPGGTHTDDCTAAGTGDRSPVDRGRAVQAVVLATRHTTVPPCRCLTGGERFVTGGPADRMAAAISPDDDLETTIEQVRGRRGDDVPTPQQRRRLRQECPDVTEEDLDEYVPRARQLQRLATMTFENEDWHEEFHADPAFRDHLEAVTGGHDDDEAREAWADHLGEEARDRMRVLLDRAS